MTLADALEAHRTALSKGGGRVGLLREADLLSALARPYSGYHRPIANKSAALLHAVVKNHPFVDGNKRTAWQLAFLVIRRSGYDLDLKDSERIDDIVVGVAESKIDFGELAMWFKDRLIKR